ncbi:MAG: ankyrin repeat domain-containing protein, partial [Bacteroidales bacterium]|nr:ankyrin repeat domain-containing protein [Bacteroidales bacterium]
MARSGNLIRYIWLITGMVLTMGPTTLLCGQEQEKAQEKPQAQEEPQAQEQTHDLFTLSDTSYFKTDMDDWNLVESVLRGEYSSVLMLLKRGADPDAKAEGGMTALMYAAENGDTMMVKLLVLNGADLEL